MDKKTTVYYAKNADEAARIRTVLQANGIQAEEKGLGENVYHDIYGGNGAYGREILVKEENEEQARVVIRTWQAGCQTVAGKKSGESSNLAGKILLAAAVLLVIVLLFLK